MQVSSPIQQTTFSDLKPTEIFTGRYVDGSSFIAMKVMTREQQDDDASPDVVVFSKDKPPALYTGTWAKDKKNLAKLSNLTFKAYPRQPSDVINDANTSSDSRARSGAGCVHFRDNTPYLGVEVKFASHAEQTFYVNMQTGECWHSAWVGSLNMRNDDGKQFNLIKHGVALPYWQIIETNDIQQKVVIDYEMPGALVTRAA